MKCSVISELVVGYMLPGRPVAMMLFKTWGYITMAQALTFTSDFKLGHYMKIPSVIIVLLAYVSVRTDTHLILILTGQDRCFGHRLSLQSLD